MLWSRVRESRSKVWIVNREGGWRVDHTDIQKKKKLMVEQARCSDSVGRPAVLIAFKNNRLALLIL